MKSSARTGSWRAAIIRIFRETTAAARVPRGVSRLRSAARSGAPAVVRRPPGDSATAPTGSADEVAIDFPSVSQRARSDARFVFRGSRRRVPHRPRSCVSPQEAFWGTIVPLDVPLRRTCPRCGGRGEVWDGLVRRPAAAAARCRDAHEMRLRVPAGVREGATLPVQRRAAGRAADPRRSPD